MDLARSIVYFGDPLCSWCYGFSPVLLRIQKEFGSQAPFRAVMGGLRPGIHAEKMDQKLKRFLKHHWDEVHRTTGQEFGFRIFDRDDFVYDTEPSCRAVVIARTLKPEIVFDYFNAVQTAFYRDNLDPTKADTMADVFESLGGDRGEFMRRWDSEDARAETVRDFEFTASVGVRGFPTLVFVDAAGVGLTICRGYLPYDDVRERLEFVLNQSKPVQQATVEACDIEKGSC